MFRSNTTTGGGLLSRVSSLQTMMYENKKTVIGLLLLFTIIAIVFYYYFTAKPSYKANNEFTEEGVGQGKHAELMLFYVDWCPHCKTAKPVWD